MSELSKEAWTNNHDHSIRPIDDDWAQLEVLWVALYRHQREHGMLIELPPDAYQLWVSALKPLMGRFGFVFVAEEAQSLVGFLAGRIRSMPAHFGSQPAGFIGEVFVLDSHRGRGIAQELLSLAQSWFHERDVHRVELQVVAGNTQAREFYLRRGWAAELIQMVWRDE
jgi:GNAT superfamily N-acetyltransferase